LRQACRKWLATVDCPFMVCSTITTAPNITAMWLVGLQVFQTAALPVFC
jgi:hypothetical protein